MPRLIDMLDAAVGRAPALVDHSVDYLVQQPGPEAIIGEDGSVSASLPSPAASKGPAPPPSITGVANTPSSVIRITDANIWLGLPCDPCSSARSDARIRPGLGLSQRM